MSEQYFPWDIVEVTGFPNVSYEVDEVLKALHSCPDWYTAILKTTTWKKVRKCFRELYPIELVNRSGLHELGSQVRSTKTWEEGQVVKIAQPKSLTYCVYIASRQHEAFNRLLADFGWKYPQDSVLRSSFDELLPATSNNAFDSFAHHELVANEFEI